MATERDIILEQLNNNSPIYFKSFKNTSTHLNPTQDQAIDMNLEINNNNIILSYVGEDNLHIKSKIINNKKIGDIISRINNDNKLLIKFTIIEYNVLCLVKRKYNYIAEIILNNNDKEMSTFKMSVYTINRVSSYGCNYFLDHTYYSNC
jgi:hypothetical protein